MNQGRIELESGSWTWQVTRMKGNAGAEETLTRPTGETDPDPEPGAGRRVLLLEDSANPGDWMIRRLDPEVEPTEVEDRVEDLATHPDRRQLQDPDGTAWTVEVVPPPESIREGADFERPPLKIRAARGGAPARIIELPEDRPLGTLSADELRDLLARSGSEDGEAH